MPLAVSGTLSDMRRKLFIVAVAFALAACQQQMGPEAQALYDEELAKLEGEQ